METQEETAPPAQAKLIDEVNGRVKKFIGQAQVQFRETGLSYSQKLCEYFEKLGDASATDNASATDDALATDDASEDKDSSADKEA